MQEELKAIKREFSVIDEFNIYNTESKQFDMLESDHCVDMVQSMDELDCLNEMNQINLDSEEANYFIIKGINHRLAVIRLNNKVDYNKALFTIKVKTLIKSIE
ncbi:MAG: hypothetical protein CMP48_20780 [Rickettsiales bacterium]|nr:hypothetical protein [Rickettsiales bacterium]